MSRYYTGAIVLEGRDQVDFARLCALKAALRLEIAGMKRRGRSASAILRQDYGFKAKTKTLLYDKVCEEVERRHNENARMRAADRGDV